MNPIKRFHFLFEQSGTFRDVARRMGYDAYDYDICDDFHKTDFVIDLFKEIMEAVQGRPSLFDEFSKDDVLMAFFPCIRFSIQFGLIARSDNYAMRNDSIGDKCDRFVNCVNDIAYFSYLVGNLVHECDKRGLRLVIENPYSKNSHFLSLYFPFKPQVNDMNRRAHGDYFAKPTQYWFFGFEPYDNPLFMVFDFVPHKKVTECASADLSRSLIHPQYAEYFLRTHVIPLELQHDLAFVS